MTRYFLCLYLLTAVSQAFGEPSEVPALSPTVPETAENNTSYNQTEIMEFIAVDQTKSVNQLPENYYVYNNVHETNATEPIVNNSISQLASEKSALNFTEGKSRPLVQFINLLSNSTLETTEPINIINDDDFLVYNDELRLQMISELEKFNDGLNKFNTPLIRTKRDPEINGTINDASEQLINHKIERVDPKTYNIGNYSKFAKTEDESFVIIRESVARRLGLDSRKKYNSLAEIIEDYLQRQNASDEDDDNDDDDVLYNY